MKKGKKSLAEKIFYDSIDKIITTKNNNINISNVAVIRYDRDHLDGHWPISFNINWSG